MQQPARRRVVSAVLALMFLVPFSGASAAKQVGACGVIPQGYDEWHFLWMHGGAGDPQWSDYHTFGNWDNLHASDEQGIIIHHTAQPHQPNCGA